MPVPMICIQAAPGKCKSVMQNEPRNDQKSNLGSTRNQTANNILSGERKLVRVGNYMMTGKVLGKGHFARVEEAVHGVLNVKVAVKIINVSEITDQYVKKNLKREASIMSKISHPNIVYLFETIETEKNYYIVTEIGSGGDLCTYVKSQRYGKLDERKSRPLARQLASAVGHLHDKGVVHRDLKMENILLDYTKEKIKLVDFGLSNVCKAGDFLRTHCGSPEYAAPELYVSGRRYGAEVDIWSLGVVFYGMMMGKLPFQTLYKPGVTHEEKRKHLMEETKCGLTMKHQKALTDCSHLFRNLIPKMLNPNSKDRITMKELQKHAWIYGNQIGEFPGCDEDWQREIMTKIANFLEIQLYDVYSQIMKTPYGPVGGIYNIEKLAHLIRKVKTINIVPRIDFKAIKGASPKAGSVRPLTYTSRDRIVQDPDNEGGAKRRPKTAEGIQIQNDLKATTNFQIRNKEMQVQIKRENSTSVNSKPPTTKDRTSSKMLNFLNEKISRAFNIYAKRGSGQYEIQPKRVSIETPATKPPSIVPSASGITKKPTDSNMTSIAALSLQNDTGSENSSVKQTARTKFIKYLCTPNKYQRTSSRKLRSCTAPDCVPTREWKMPTSPKKSEQSNKAPTVVQSADLACRAPVLSRYLNYMERPQLRKSATVQQMRGTVNSGPPTKHQQHPAAFFASHSPSCSRNASFTNSKKRAAAGIPSHTAMRAAIRRELATRCSPVQTKSKA